MNTINQISATPSHTVNITAKAETLILQTQMLTLKDFDEQVRTIAEQIKFLSGIKRKYRDAITTVQNFTTQNPDTSRKDGKRITHATFAQMAELTGALTVYEYDTDAMSVTEQGMTLPMNGDGTKLDDADADGTVWANVDEAGMNTADMHDYFAHGATLTDDGEAMEFANLAGSDDGRLFFYHGNQGNKTEDGKPLFAVYAEPLEALLQQLRDRVSGVENESEQLSLKLNGLMAQRKLALEGAGELVRKMDQVRQNSLGKMS